MNISTRNRLIIFGAVLIGLFAILFIQLIKLTLVKGADYAAEAEKKRTETITISGARGSILDRNGLPLAYDQKSYNVEFYRDPNKSSTADRAFYTGVIMKTIDLVEKNGGETIDTFAIKYNAETGVYDFDWGDISAEAKTKREGNWRKNMYVNTDPQMTPEQIYIYLRDRYQVPTELGYDEARKILSIWQEVQLASWLAFDPVTVAYNVNIQTVAEIETHGVELSGMNIEESTTRVYPRGTLAAHLLGYLGRMTDPETMKDMKLKGYDQDDLLGITGLEKSMEEYLTGNSTERQGKKVVEVDNMAVIQNVLSSTEPKQGYNVITTIDVPLQQAAEEALAKRIPEMRQKQLEAFDLDEEGAYKRDNVDINKVKLADQGAAVVIDVNNGNVLAAASYPTYDPNLFIEGMTEEEYEALGFKDKELAPLLNRAVSSRGIPGSVFKMVTSLAALMEGKTTLEERITDMGEYTAILKPNSGGHGPKCWVKNPSNHKDQTIVEGLMNSCDYYFYTLANRLGIDLLNKWGEIYGLTDKTGIELPGEAVGQIGGQQVVYDPAKSLKEQKSSLPYLVKYSEKYGLITALKKIASERSVEYDEQTISDTADALIALAGIDWGEDPTDKQILKDKDGRAMGDYIRSVLQDKMDIPVRVSAANGWSQLLSPIIGQLIWTPYMTITSGIGQGVVLVTPMAVARYVASIVNGGTVYETHLVDKVVDQNGQVVFEQQPEVYGTLGAPQEYLDRIMKGMGDVVTAEDGTARKYFKDFKYKHYIGGKTGTAEVTEVDLENNSWFVCFAPYKTTENPEKAFPIYDGPDVKPEIAVVVYVPHGLSGGLSSYIAQDIVEFYLDREQKTAEQKIPATDSLITN